MKFIKILTLVFCVVVCRYANAQFTSYQPQGMPSINESASQFADYDGDGRLDLLISGSNGINDVLIYFNQTSAGLIANTTSTPFKKGFKGASIEHVDIDEDGNTDFVISGDTKKSIGNQSFDIPELLMVNNVIGFQYTNLYNQLGVTNGDVECGDIDNDGDKDLIISGIPYMVKDIDFALSADNAVPVTYILENKKSFTGSNEYVIRNLNNPFPGLAYSKAKLEDYDRDGDLDLFLTGMLISPKFLPYCQLYINEKGQFQSSENAIFSQYQSTFEWNDFNNDGYPDILMSGYNPQTNKAAVELYTNDQNGGFVKTIVFTPSFDDPMIDASLKTGDFDKDGYSDFILSGVSYLQSAQTLLYLNNKSGSFTRYGVVNSVPSELSVGDADGDLDLDFFGSATSDASPFSLMYKNGFSGQNTTPSVPNSLKASVDQNNVTLTWNSSSDLLTASASLTYNVTLLKDGQFFLSGESNYFTGKRQIAKRGNAGNNTFFRLENLPVGNYTFKVQAIDNSYIGSAFSNAFSFKIVSELVQQSSFLEKQLNFDFESKILDLEIANINTELIRNNSALYQDDLPDIISLGVSKSNFSNGFYLNKGNSSFNFSLNIDKFPILSKAAKVKFGYLDNDTKPDLIISGIDSSGNFVTKLYQNATVNLVENDYIFLDQKQSNLPAMAASSILFFDIDSDGDDDLFLSGKLSTGNNLSGLFENKGGFKFESTKFQIPQISEFADYGDFDNDGDLDLLLSSGLYVNNKGVFTNFNLAAAILNVYDLKEFNDYDNDGRLDIILKNKYLLASTTPALLKNLADSTFIKVDLVTNIPDMSYNNYSLYDFDNDGKKDIISASKINGRDSLVILSNISLNNFSYLLSSNSILSSTKYKIADLDRDSKLDVVLYETEIVPSNQYSIRLLSNRCVLNNNRPNAPTNLKVEVIGDLATFSWDKSEDTEQAAISLTYQLMVWDSVVTRDYPYVNFISSANCLMNIESDKVTAFLSPNLSVNENLNSTQSIILNKGNVGTEPNKTIKINKNGTFYASVYAIDNSNSISQELEMIKFHVNSFISVDLPKDTLSKRSLLVVDWDQDEDYDILISGRTTNIGKAYVLINSNNTFKDSIIKIEDSIVLNNPVPKDIDGDDNFEFLIDSAGDFLYVYKKDFAIYGIKHGIQGFVQNKSTWYDYDNDGDWDIVAAGKLNNTSIILLFENKNGQFSLTNYKFPSLVDVGLSVEDFDSDGINDLFVSGFDESTKEYRSLVYLKTKNGFNESFSGFTATSNTIYNWGDYDNDGDKDLLLYGKNKLGSISGFYKNNNNGNFTELVSNGELSIFETTSAKWYDYDNDGDLDIIGSGSANAQIFENSNGFFEKVKKLALPKNEVDAHVGFGDFDNDKKNDIVYIGDAQFKIFYNNNLTKNNAPTIPVILKSEVVKNLVKLSWNESIDDITESSTIGYNVTLRKGNNVLLSKIMANGNTKLDLSHAMVYNPNFSVTNLADGKYYWSVQAVDQAYKASLFSVEDSFVVALEPVINGQGIACNYEELTYSVNPFDEKYLWEVTPKEGAIILSDSLTGNQLRVKWNKPGKYQIKVVNTEFNLDTILLITIKDNPTPSFKHSYPNKRDKLQVQFIDSLLMPISSVHWDFGNSKSDSISRPIHQYESPEKYAIKLSVSYQNGCKNDSLKEIRIQEPRIDGDSVACLNETKTYTIFPTGFKYFWDVTNGTVIKQDSKSAEILWNSTGQAKIIIKNDELGFYDTLYIQVNPKPLASVIIPSNIGINELIQFKDSVSVDVTKYEWEFDKDTILLESSPTFTFKNNGRHTITFVATNGFGCKSSITKDINIQKPEISGSKIVCKGAEIIYTVSPKNYRYTWKVSKGIILSQSDTACSVRWEGIGDGSLTVQNDSLRYINSLRVQINQTPEASIKMPDNIGINEMVKFTDSVSSDVTSFSWDFNEPGKVFNVSSPMVEFTQTGQHKIVFVASNIFGCSKKITTELNIQKPIFTDGPKVTCQGIVQRYIVTPEANYQWIVTKGTILIRTKNSCSVLWDSTGTGVLTVKEESLKYENSISVQINPTPIASVHIPENIGRNELIKFVDSVSLDVDSIYWDFDEPGKIFHYSSPTVVFSRLGQHAITFIATNNFGCAKTIRSSVNIQKPEIDSKNISVCEGAVENYTVSPKGFQYTWKAKNGIVLNQSSESVTISWLTSGDGQVIVYNTELKYIDTLNVVINKNPSAWVNIPNEISINALLKFKDSVSSDVTIYSWDFDEPGKLYKQKSPEVVFEQSGKHNVVFSAINAAGCSKIIQNTILVSAEITPLLISNLLTPNADGKNDNLYIENLERYPENEVKLLNAWGKEVFSKSGYENDWDLKLGDEYLPSGSYLCTVVLKKFGKRFEKIVTVMR